MSDAGSKAPAIDFQELVNRSDDAIVLVDLDGKVIFESPAIEKITGMKPELRSGAQVFELVHPDEIATVQKLFNQVKSGEEHSLTTQFRIRHVSGDWRWVEARGSLLVKVAEGNAVVITLRDITSQKHLEMELKSSYEVLSSIYSQTADILFYLGIESDSTYRFLSVNKSFYTTTGLREDQVIGKLVPEVIPEPSLSIVMAKYKDAVKTKKAITWIETTPYPTGTKYGEVTVQPIVNSEGVCTHLVGSVHDITPLKEAENKLTAHQHEILEQKAFSDAILASVGEGVVAVDTEGKITLMNGAAEKLLGWTYAEIKGKKYSEVWNVKDRSGAVVIGARPIAESMKTGLPLHSEDFQYERRDKSFLPVSVTVSPILQDGTSIGAVSIFRDTSREKALDFIKTEFVALAGHQLRTPLTGLRWALDLMISGDRGELSDKARETVLNCNTSVERMINIVNNLLVVSRIDMGILQVEPKPISVTDVAKEVLEGLRTQIQTKKLKLKEFYAAAIPTIQSDPQLLRIILENLLSNAVRYTLENGNVELEIKPISAGNEVDGQKAQSESLFIRVSDTGTGIPENEKEKIFSKLFRSSKVTDFENSVGSGMGLYIVKALVDISDGRVWFDSTEGKGSTFYVLLPLSGMRRRAGEKLPGTFSIEKATNK